MIQQTVLIFENLHIPVDQVYFSSSVPTNWQSFYFQKITGKLKKIICVGNSADNLLLLQRIIAKNKI